MPQVASTGTVMRELRGGEFAMGSERFYADEGPVHLARVEAFLLDEHPVTNEQFGAFVADTGYLTTAERPLPAADFPDRDAAARVPGSLVFHASTGPVPLSDWRQWWVWVPGASWAHPFGPASSIDGRERHPVVQVSFEDASRYANWADKRLPTEEEWEFAARGGLDSATFAWGEEARPGGTLMANTWQGAFPYLNRGANGWRGTSPVGSFPPNPFGFVDLIGNVWEWTTTAYLGRHPEPCCVGDDSAGDAGSASGQEALRVLKGGSHLCAPEYCLRYRPAARSPQSDDSSTTHIGFRCARSL